ncbi:MAG: excinuclease ABC subunit UvrC [Syntrophomonadaceae bacterium]|nr:excinuclease ABC subunit UvrC [Syntrophomonadaceae bacterium]
MKERLKKVPRSPGVYLFKDTDGNVIYVGKARLLKNRLRSYFQTNSSMDPKVRAMMNRVVSFEYVVTNSEVEALILENNLIKTHKPKYNINLRDDKTYPYLKLTTGEKFPRLCVAREEKDKVSRYFGPYPDVSSLRRTVQLLTSIFPLRSCRYLTKRPRPCLNYDIGKCLAPCMGKVTEQEYNQAVKAVIRFLEGNHREILQAKEREMYKASQELDFERAAVLRDQLASLHKLVETQKVSYEQPYDLDVVGEIYGTKQSLIVVHKIRAGKIITSDTLWVKQAINESESEVMHYFIKHFYDDNPDIPKQILLNIMPSDPDLVTEWLCNKSSRKVQLKIPYRGEKKAMLEMVLQNARILWEEKMDKDAARAKVLLHLSRVLNLEVIPERIEGYDVSHTGGSDTVASMVVFINGVSEKKLYRRFKIKVEQNNDFASLSEAIARRLKQAKEKNPSFLPEPDLIVVDGGQGQVNLVHKTITENGFNIPVVGLAKKQEEIYRMGASGPLILSRRDEGLKVLQRLRDEAHRFALDYNRQLRKKKMSRSVLDQIEGIASKRKNALIAHFGSISRLREADLEEIAKVPGMNRKAAENVFWFFHNTP